MSYDTLILLGRVAIVAVAVLTLAVLGRPTPTAPTPDRTFHVDRATELERLQHDLHQAWELDQPTKK